LIESAEEIAMAARVESKPRVPSFVGAFNPIARRMLGLGIPLGPNALITILGRKSGLDRTTPVALVEIDGRRWVIGTFGETHWVRNLRAAGEATITVRRRQEVVGAVELARPDGVEFFRNVLGPYVRKIPFGLGRWMLGSLLGAHDILQDPDVAADRHPVFELHAA
jgi:deazaflavin-dependent oxidoreductase (nitroreductase family)